MKINFYLRYTTKFGQSLFVSLGNDENPSLIPLEYSNEEYWHGVVEFDDNVPDFLPYAYHFKDIDGTVTTEWGNDRVLDLKSGENNEIQAIDIWNAAASWENAFMTKPFQEILLKNQDKGPKKKSGKTTHTFRVKAPLLDPDEALCLLGHGKALRNWDVAAPLLMALDGNWWTISLDLTDEDFPLGYKYGVWNRSSNRFMGFEAGHNRILHETHRMTVLHDGFAHFPNDTFKGAGTAIPVFSLRTQKSFGVGEFTDMHLLVDWAKSVGLKLLQLLPINDTTANYTWTDSYPYAAVSAFALNPIYLNVEQVAGKKQAAIYKKYAKKQAELNALPAVDYDAVIHTKWEIIRLLFAEQKVDWAKDADYLQYLEENKHWLQPYAAFCYLRDKNKTPDFTKWSSHQVFEEKELEKLLSPKAAHADEVAIHLFVQWHLHQQLKSAADYAHQQGLVVKGDLPIGIYRYSCDAWVAPELYNMDAQAGAPPDDFAEKGQNWGFPTYNWQRMQDDGFAWWKQRFAQMSLYFDVFRIDHILGFFRIWSIPLHAVEGILGYFVPALPVTASELEKIGLDYERLCKPYITDEIVDREFGERSSFFKSHFLEKNTHDRYQLKPEYSTQRQVEDYLNTAGERLPVGTDGLESFKTAIFNLITNVLLLEVPGSGQQEFHFRFGIEKISSFRALNPHTQHLLKTLYVDYFYRRQDDFWKIQAMEKLPALKRSTNMLICGEDLGMVPDCVPGVMRDMGFLSLEIQRMPKDPKTRFFNPKNAPYLSVVTPSTHDMSTIRGWWEEDRLQTQQFYNEILGRQGYAPFFCEPWVNHQVLEQHFYSPAMWAIFQIQDLLGMDAKLRRENPEDERINIPANPKHYWRYRMHLGIEQLMEENDFNDAVRRLVAGSGRG